MAVKTAELFGLISDFDKTLDTPEFRKSVPLETRIALKQWKAAGNVYVILTGIMLPGCNGTAGEPILDTHDLADVVLPEEGGVWWFPKENRIELKAPRLAEDAERALRVWRDEPGVDGKAKQVWIGLTAIAGFAKNEPEVTEKLQSLGYTVIGKNDPLAIGPNDDDPLIATKTAKIKDLHQKSLAERGLSGPEYEDRILQITYNADWIEYLGLGINKTHSAKAIKAHFGIDKVIATGDGANDTFIDVADISWAVNNAVQDLKFRSSRVSERAGGYGVGEAILRAMRPRSARVASRALRENNLDRFWHEERGLEVRQNQEYQRLVKAFFGLNPSLLGQCVKEKGGDLLATSRFPYRVVGVAEQPGTGAVRTTLYVSDDRRQAIKWATDRFDPASGRVEVLRNMLKGRWLVTDTIQMAGGVLRSRDRVAERDETPLRRIRSRCSVEQSPYMQSILELRSSVRGNVAESVQMFGRGRVAVLLDGAVPSWIRKYVAWQLRDVPEDAVAEAAVLDEHMVWRDDLQVTLDRYLEHETTCGHPTADGIAARGGWNDEDSHGYWIPRYAEWIFITDGNIPAWPKEMPTHHTSVIVVSPHPEQVKSQLEAKNVEIANASFTFVKVSELEKTLW